MFTSLLSRFLMATKVATGVTAIAAAIMAINYTEAVHGKKIRKFLSSPGEEQQKHKKGKA